MPNVTVKIDKKLLKQLDNLVDNAGYISRADFVRAAIRYFVRREKRKMRRMR